MKSLKYIALVIVALSCAPMSLHALNFDWLATAAGKTEKACDYVSQSKIVQTGAAAVIVAGTAMTISAAYDELVKKDKDGLLLLAAALCIHTVNYHHFIKPLLHALATSKKMADKP